MQGALLCLVVRLSRKSERALVVWGSEKCRDAPRGRAAGTRQTTDVS